jgi:hypothetical protein
MCGINERMKIKSNAQWKSFLLSQSLRPGEHSAGESIVTYRVTQTENNCLWGDLNMQLKRKERLT